MVVTAFIVHVGWEVTRELLQHLMDGVDPDLLAPALWDASASRSGAGEPAGVATVIGAICLAVTE